MDENKEKILDAVRTHYSKHATSSACCAGADAGGTSAQSCCAGKGCCSAGGCEPVAPGDEFTGPMLGCGSPLDHVELTLGMDVLDIGSGAGREVLEAARRVGPTGISYGLDMNDDMLALAQENRRRAQLPNAVFVKGYMEDIPLPASSVDLIISNCVINLSSDKDKTLSELHRVLRPGGRLGISDTVATGGKIPDSVKNNMDLWCSCASGSMEPEEYEERLRHAGFVDVSIDVRSWDGGLEGLGEGILLGSAIVSAVKPA